MNLVTTFSSQSEYGNQFLKNLSFGQSHVASNQITKMMLEPEISNFNWLEKDFRDSIVNSSVDHTIASQIKCIREDRGWSQAQLADFLASGQSAIARMEDAMYGSHSINTLKKLANIFDCGLVVRFVDHDAVALLMDHVSPAELAIKNYEEIASKNFVALNNTEILDGE